MYNGSDHLEWRKLHVGIPKCMVFSGFFQVRPVPTVLERVGNRFISNGVVSTKYRMFGKRGHVKHIPLLEYIPQSTIFHKFQIEA